jgi:hypothetical protein
MSNNAPKDDWLDFEIEKVHQSLYEAGKCSSQTFFTYLALAGLTGLLSYGQGAKDEVAVPLIQLTVDKRSAALIVHILAIMVIFWFQYLVAYENALMTTLSQLIRRRYEIRFFDEWQFMYPSFPIVIHKFMLGL